MEPQLLQKISVIIPSLNPDEKLKKTVAGLLAVGFTDIVLVNDGSREDCLANFPTANEHITVLTHPVNRGKGAALKTAFAFLKANRKDSVGAVSVDGDGQHDANDVLRCAEEMVAQGDKIILGCRDFSEPQVPKRSRFGNRLTSGVFKLLCGMRVSDTQTGLRAFPAKYYGEMLSVSGERFEYETKMLLEMKARNIPYAEVKIRTVYIEENKTSHFHPIRDSFKIYSFIFKHLLSSKQRPIKFALSSCVASVLEMTILWLVMHFCEGTLHLDLCLNTREVLVATSVSVAFARLMSSLFNFVVNRKIVFHSNAPLGKSLLRYYAVALPNMLLQNACTTFLKKNLYFINSPTRVTALSFCVSVILFVISYTFQNKWVFKRKEK